MFFVSAVSASSAVELPRMNSWLVREARSMVMAVNAIHRVSCGRRAIRCPSWLNGFTGEHAEAAEQLELFISAFSANSAVSSSRTHRAGKLISPTDWY